MADADYDRELRAELLMIVIDCEGAPEPHSTLVQAVESLRAGSQFHDHDLNWLYKEASRRLGLVS